MVLCLQLMVSVKFGPADDNMKSTWHRVVNKLIWLVGTARNAILVVVTGLFAYFLHESGQRDLQLIGEIPPGMPDFQFPPFSIPDIRNETTGEIIQKGETFSEMVSAMGSSLIVIPLIALLENIAVCKAFGEEHIFPWSRPTHLLTLFCASFSSKWQIGRCNTGTIGNRCIEYCEFVCPRFPRNRFLVARCSE